MISRVNFAAQNYNNKASFKGEKEVQMLVKKTEELEKYSSEITDFGFDLSMMLKRQKITRQDIAEAAKLTKEEWKANILKQYSTED